MIKKIDLKKMEAKFKKNLIDRSARLNLMENAFKNRLNEGLEITE